MKKIETEIVIDTPTSTVWNILTDFEGHPRWNPFIESIEGDKRQGGRLKVIIRPPGGKAMTFKPDILKYDANREFRWQGKLGIKGVFDGEHYFILEALNADRTKLIHGEKFSGIFVPLMGGALAKTREGFELMNRALKKRCENSD